MTVLGLILIMLTGVFTAAVFLGNTDTTSAQAFGQTLSGISLGGFFVAGAVTGLLFAFGLYLLFRGLRRRRRRNLEHRQVVRETKQEQASLAAEKQQLERELERERQRRATPATSEVATERTVVERQPVQPGDSGTERAPVAETSEDRRTDVGSESVTDKPRLFRR